MSNVWMRVGAVAPLVALLFMTAGESAQASLPSPQKDSLLAQTEPTAITDIQLRSTDGTVELWLETSGDLAPTTTSISGNTLTVEIDAVLALTTADIFSVTDPAADITNITVTQINNRVRIDITGQETAPSITPRPNATGLVLTIAPESSSVVEANGESEPLRLVVTGENEDDYRVPNASTATRTDTPVLDIPASIQVIPQQVLEDQQVTRLDEALSNVSGVTFGGTFVNTSLNFNIRGFDAPTLRNGFRDFGGFTGVSPTITNLERVEVLKGPASILYGEVQPGGLINLVTEQPLSEPTYELAARVGNRGVFQPQVDLSGPITPDQRLLYRLNASYFHDDGFTDFDQDIKQTFVAPVLAWQISERTNLTINAEYLNDQQPFETGLVAFGDGVVDVPFDRIISEPDNFTDSELFRIGYDLKHDFNEQWHIRNAFEYSNRDLQNVSALPLDFDETTGFVTRFPSQQELDTENFSLQTNIVGEFATGSVGHTLLAGVDLNRTEDSEVTGFDFFTPSFLDIFNPVYGLVTIDEENLPLFADNDIQTDRLGIYLQDQIDITDNLILLAGIRYDTVEQETTNNPTDLDPIGSETTQNDDAWTPRVGIVYQPADFLSLFASYSQSFTPNLGTTAAGDPLEPEEGEGFEVGIKAELLEGDLLATLAYFDITRQNVATPDPLDPFSSVATGKQRSQGVELDIVGEIMPGWNIIASYAYTNARVTEDNVIPDGNGLFNAPEHSASLWTTYEITSGELQGLGFGAGFNFVGERDGDLDNSFVLDDYFLTNAGVFYRRDNWRFALNAKNLFDVDYIAASNNSRTSGLEPGAPFTIVGSVSVTF